MRLQLIDHWKTVLWSSTNTRATALLTFAVGAVGQYYMAGFAFLAFMPPEIQVPAGGAILMVLLGGPLILARIVKQPKLAAKIDAKEAEQTNAGPTNPTSPPDAAC